MAEKIYKAEEIIANRYVVQEMLGAGSFSHVYKALDTLSSDVVALKIFKDTSDVLDQLRNEFSTLKQLHHTHIAQVYDIGQLPDRSYYLKLEYIEGRTLNHLIHDNQISLSKARQITQHLLDAVAYMHSKHIMHRDITPKNVISSDRGTMIIDFNISKLVESHAATRVGTPRYMPPEVNRAGWNWTGDLYAIGLILYEMVTGHYPYEDHLDSTSTATDPRNHNQAISDSLTQFILKAVAKEPTERFQTASEMLSALEGVDWKPGWRPYHMSSLDLSRIPINEEEKAKPNYNPYLMRLLTLYSQSHHTNAGTRGLDALAHATYVQTQLDTKLRQDILNADSALIIITGNAGDGKTAFIQKLEQEVETQPSTTIFESLPTGNGCRFVHNGVQFLTNYDGSQDEGLVDNDRVLWEFFKPFGGDTPINLPDRVHIIAINEGRLIDFLQSNSSDFPHLYQQTRDFFERELPPDDPQLLIVNLNLRAVVADGQDGLAIFDQMVSRMTAPALWGKCQTCDIANRCYAKFNADSLNDTNYGPQIRRRLKALFQITHFRQRLHITIRDLRSALAYTLFGVEDCDGIHTMLREPSREPEFLSRYYYNSLFNSSRPEHISQDRLVRLLAQIDPGEVANPKLDARLNFTPPNELTLLPPFDARSDYDQKLLRQSYDNLLSLEPNGNSDDQEADLISANQTKTSRRYHSVIRRRVYFERLDKDWLQMLPYTQFGRFLDLMTNPNHTEMEANRDWLIHAISLSEGIFNLSIGQDYLCLRTSQETRVAIKSFRRFNKNRFRCKVQEIGRIGQYVEHIPTVLILEYIPVAGIRMEINLDLYEMLHRIKQGYTPSLNELRGSYINLLIFKRQLASTEYDEVLLTEDEQTFYLVHKTPDKKLVIAETTQITGEE